MITHVDIRQNLAVALIACGIAGCAGKPAQSTVHTPDVVIPATQKYNYEVPTLTTNAVLQIVKDYVISKKIRLRGYGEPVAYFNLLKWTVTFESVPPIPDDNLYVIIDDRTGTVTKHSFH